MSSACGPPRAHEAEHEPEVGKRRHGCPARNGIREDEEGSGCLINSSVPGPRGSVLLAAFAVRARRGVKRLARMRAIARPRGCRERAAELSPVAARRRGQARGRLDQLTDSASAPGGGSSRGRSVSARAGSRMPRTPDERQRDRESVLRATMRASRRGTQCPDDHDDGV